MSGILTTILKGVFMVLQIPLIIFFTFVAWFIIVCGIYLFKGYKKGRKIPKSAGKKPKKIGILKRIFILFPKQYVEDLFNKKEDYFAPQGLICFAGRQGGGKTVAMVEYLLRLQMQYPKCKAMTNFAYKHEGLALNDWTQLIDFKNSHHGVVIGMDELQNWFSSKSSANFPPEMLAVITQNRKNRRIILGTAQNFYMLSKDLRTQCVEVRDCITLAGCLTIVRRKEPICDANGDVKEYKRRGMYFFVHSAEIRESYDTYKVIENLRKSGFLPKSITQNDVTVNTTYKIKK